MIEHLLQLAEDEKIDQKTLKQDYEIGPSVIQRGVEEGWCEVKEVELYRDPYEKSEFQHTEPLKLNQEQQVAYDKINGTIQNDEHEVFLLQGVTGSGKRKFIFNLLLKGLKDQGALVLVPEIALTPQMVHRFKGRFGELVAVLHSGLSDGENMMNGEKLKKEKQKL